MGEATDDLVEIAMRCEQAAKRFQKEPLRGQCKRLREAADSLDAASSRSWLGYHASVYTEGLRARLPGEHFDSQWGMMDRYSNRGTGEWREYTSDEVEKEILRRAHVTDPDTIGQAAKEVGNVFDECKRDLLPTFDVILEIYGDAALKELRQKLDKLKSHFSRTDYATALQPKGQFITHDTLALQGGFQAPYHIAFATWVMEQQSYAEKAVELARIARHAATYLKRRRELKGKIVAKSDGPVFIGHGRSALWKELKELLVERLKLEYEEFNRVPAAGRSTKERLLEMLDKCCFAFLIMTAEDEHGDGSKHARQNVVHEAGLFQGRHGFERAIILREDGCEEFSNMAGIVEIRFPKGNLGAVSEDVRGVLEREGIIGAP